MIYERIAGSCRRIRSDQVKNVIRILRLAKPYWKYLIIAMAALVAYTGCQLTAPSIIRNLVSLIQMWDKDLAQKSLQFALFLCGVYLLQGVCQFLRSYLTHFAAWNFVSDMRVRMYNHLQKLSLKYYHDKQTGQLMSRTTNDTAMLETLIAHAAPDLIVNVLLLAGISIILFSINATLALLSLITVPFLVIAVSKFATRVLPQFKNSQQALAEFNAVLHDNLSGIKEIQVFNQQEREHARIHHRSMSYVKATLKVLRLSAIYHPSVEFFNNLGMVLVIGVGGYLASTQRIPLADIIAFILYLGIFYQPIGSLGRLNEDMQNALAGASRIFEVLDSEPDVVEKHDAVKIGRAKGSIIFEDVRFQYIEGIDVVKDINIRIEPGEMVALVGPTGVGKTTLASLISRFYDPTEGRILLDGVDLKELSLKSLRENISIVLQDIFLFNGTVEENIAYGAAKASREEVMEAAKVAHAHEFIEGLENGYGTVIGERGVKLSGGQKQRLSIARAVLRNSPILILDEATASVDMETEKLIHDAIDKVIKNRTTIIIAHRLSSIKKADKIIVLDDGGIVEMGTHNQLIKENGLYSKLCSLQFAGREAG